MSPVVVHCGPGHRRWFVRCRRKRHGGWCLDVKPRMTIEASAKSGSDETISVRSLTKSGACLSAKVLSKKLDLVTVGEVRRTRGARAAGMSAADETGHAAPRKMVRV